MKNTCTLVNKGREAGPCQICVKTYPCYNHLCQKHEHLRFYKYVRQRYTIADTDWICRESRVVSCLSKNQSDTQCSNPAKRRSSENV